MLKSETVDIEELAEALGRSPSWLKRNFRSLNREHCLPLPLPDKAWRFPRRACELWLIAGGVVQRLPANDHSCQPQASYIELQRRELQKRYGGAQP